MKGNIDNKAPDRNNKKTSKVFNTIMIVSAAIIVISTIVIIVVTVRYNNMTRRDKLNLDQYIAVTAIDILGGNSSRKNIVTDLKTNETEKTVFLTMYKYSSERCILETIKMMKELVNDTEFMNMTQDNISFQWVMNVVDSYGNIKPEIGCIITFKKEDFKKIKWDTVTTDGIRNVASKFWASQLLEE